MRHEDVSFLRLRWLWEQGLVNRSAFSAIRSHSEFQYYLHDRPALDLLFEYGRLSEIHPQMIEEVRRHRDKEYASKWRRPSSSRVITGMPASSSSANLRELKTNLPEALLLHAQITIRKELCIRYHRERASISPRVPRNFNVMENLIHRIATGNTYAIQSCGDHKYAERSRG
jgi:hypothetical protein